MNREEMVANDEALADAATRIDQAQTRQARWLDALHSYTGDTNHITYIGRKRIAKWNMSTTEVLQAAKADQGPAYYRADRQRYVASYDEAVLAEAQGEADYAKYSAVWAENGRWSRFFLVPGGHIHSSTGCHSLHITTRIGWLPKLSGLTEKEAVAEHGSILCTFCYPSAPVEWTNGLDKAAEARKAAQCPGSSNYEWADTLRAAGKEVRYSRRYQTCPHCNTSQSITSTGKMRAHKAK